MRQPRRILFLLLLGLTLTVGALGAWEAHRGMRSQAATAEALLRDYGSFAAWRFGSIVDVDVGDALGHSFFPLRRPGSAPIRGPAPGPEVVYSEAAHEDCGCHFHVEGGFAFRFALGGPAEEFVTHGEVPPGIAAAIQDEVSRAARGGGFLPEQRFGIVTVADADHRAHLTYFLLARANGDTLVYGYDLDRDALQAALAGFFASGPLLPPTLTGNRESAEVLSVALVDPDGHTLFTTDPAPEASLAGSAELPARFGGLRVVASIRPEMADQLIIGGLPRSRLPFLLAVLACAVILALLVFQQFRREDHLARLRSDFVASASHELRTPLAQIRLFLETIRAGRYRTDAEYRWFLDTMDTESARLSHLVDNVLQFSRLERGLDTRAGTVPDVGALLEATLTAFRPLAATRRADLVGRFDAGLAAAIDPDALRQIVLNLLDNAVKYGPPGQTIRVDARRRDDMVEIAVEDEGPGVPESERTRIFQPFQRGASSVGSVVVGSGIGLSVVRELARAAGGDCRVENAAAGARFVLHIRLADRPRRASPVPEPQPERAHTFSGD